MSRKLTVLCGISGAGKSTLAHNIWAENPLKTIIVNRDKIRELLYGFTENTVKNFYSRSDRTILEKQVTLVEDTLIHEGLNIGKHVIVDATNLSTEHLKRFELFNVDIDYIKIECDLDTAIYRDKNRERSVGEDVIRKQYNTFKNLKVPDKYHPNLFYNDKKNKKAYIVDIDGTIAEKGLRNPFDWNRVEFDTPKEDVIELVWSLSDDESIDIIFCSGRDEVSREGTTKWLETHFKGWGRSIKLLMRKNKDMRPDWVVKEELWAQIVEEGYQILALIDDRNQVVRRARALGLTVLQVDYGNF